MARTGENMQITPVDDQNNLFCVTNAVSPDLAQLVLTTDWPSLPWSKQPGQESWPRRLIDQTFIPWIDNWHQEMQELWPTLEQYFSQALLPYAGTAFWLDEPGFVCKMHTDGELPGSLHLNWIGPATCFYWHNRPDTVRYQTPASSNSGYLMINQPDITGYRKLLWHDMTSPVLDNTFRLTSYIWLVPTT
jgi:hypothetical protein